MSLFFRRRAEARRGVANLRSRRLSPEALESRRLLAGDVDVFERRGDVFVVGDREDNSIELRVESSGQLVAVGLDGTTINGSTDPFVVSESGIIEDDLRVRLGSGDDTFLVDGVTVGDDVYVNGNRGEDSIGFLRVDVGDDAAIYGTSGSLNFSFDISSVQDDLRVVGSRGDDVVVFDDSFVGDDTTVTTSRGDDTLVVRNSVHSDDVFLSTGSGDDFIAVIDTEIGDDTLIFTGTGNDQVAVDGGSLGDRVFALGGFGRDAIQLTDVDVNRTPLALGFEGNEVADVDTVVDAAIAELVDSGARRPTLVDIATGNENFSTLVSLLAQAGLLGAVSTNDPLTVFAPTNTAFENFVEEFDLEFEDGALVIDNALLTSVLLFHVSPGNVDSGEVVSSTSLDTVQGEPISVAITDGVLLDERAGLLVIDVRARNGIVHVIDTVLTPSALDPAT